ncbi:FMN-dependent NADH-azoreductase [Arcticibacter sp.]|jgi:FMN-dependent NADH-azoreductase|uniref:FMN-dependent NADH-azoreductase n=1 Tax=Arcticibacter sp. TaxID=1872630 RepID=UPI00388EC570
MKTILHLISSPRQESSFSIKLGRAIVTQLQEKHPDSVVNEVNLIHENFPHLDAPHLQSFFTPKEDLTAADREAIRYSDQAIDQLFKADFIVIGAPLYNFSIHSALKAWIDHVARAGLTFRYSEHGPEGLVKNKKVYIAMSAGGVYSKGPYQPYDFVVPYLQAVLGFMGMTDVTVYRAEGVNMPQLKEGALERAIASIAVEG